jgi:hypothetical protein
MMSIESYTTGHPGDLDDPRKALMYQIRVRGHLGPEWTEWFDGLTITPESNGDTLLTGSVVDQAALHGLLRRVGDLGIPLLAVNQVVNGDVAIERC